MKSGYKTTEFWLTIINTVFMALVAFGVLKQEDANQLKDLIAPLVAAVVPLVMYILSRLAVKVAEAKK